MNPSSPDNNGLSQSLSDMFNGQSFQQNNGNQNSSAGWHECFTR